MPFNVTTNFDMSGGWNDSTSTVELRDNEAASSINMVFDEKGSCVKRTGYSTFGNLETAAVTGMGVFYKTDGTEHLLMAQGGDVQRYNSGTWTDVQTGLTNANFEFQTFTADSGEESVFFCNGTDFYKWNGSATSDVTSDDANAPVGKYLTVWKDRLVVAGVSANPDTIYLSGTFNGEEWSSGNDSDRIEGLDGDVITGLSTLQDNLIVFKEFSVYASSFDATPALQHEKLSTPVGAVSNRAITKVGDDGIIFLSREGVWQIGTVENLPAGISGRRISDPISNTIAEINQEQIQKACAVYWKDKWICAVPTGTSTEPNTVIVWNTRLRTWAKWELQQNPDVFVKFRDDNNDFDLYFGSADIGQVYKFDNQYSDDTNPISCEYKSKDFAISKPQNQNYLRFLTIYLRMNSAADVTVTAQTDINGDTFETTITGSEVGSSGTPLGAVTLGEGVLGGEIEETELYFVQRMISMSKMATFVNIKLTESTAGGIVQFVGYAWHSKPRTTTRKIPVQVI